MEPLGPPETHHLSAAIGWMELGNLTEAHAELAKLDPAWTEHPGALEVGWALRASAQQWSDALAIAERLVAVSAEHSTGWLHRAYALRRAPGGGLQAAWDALLPAVERFPQEPTIPYNLACYACQLGHLDQARHWFGQALAIGNKKKLKSMASADSDLQPLWAELKGL